MSDKIKKLSQAIRLGATFRPQCTGSPFYEDSSCALGAAYEATFGVNGLILSLLSTAAVAAALTKRFNLKPHVCPEIYHMNDCFNMTREEIADQLEAQGL